MEGLKRKLEGEIEIRAAGGDAFHDIFLSKPHHLSNVNPIFVQACDLHEGAFGKPGSTIGWNYTVDGKSQSSKTRIEEVDEENKVLKLNLVEGDLLKEYKSFVITYKVIPKDKESCIVIWTLEYEKLHKAIPEPTSLMDSLVELAKEVDHHHHSTAGIN